MKPLALVTLLGSLILLALISPASASASPATQDPTPTPIPGSDTYVTNNYYGIDCGTADNPCYVTLPDNVALPVINNTLYGDDCPTPGTGPGLTSCKDPLTINGPTAGLMITYTAPLSATLVDRHIEEYDLTLIYVLFAAVFTKFFIIFAIHIWEKNIFVSLYRLLLTALFVLVDILVIYPATKGLLDYTLYGACITVWLLILILERAIDFLHDLYK